VEALAEDPYPAYRALRGTEPVCTTASGAWVVLRYADVDDLWRDGRLSVERRARAQSGLADRRGAAAMLNRDDPDHARLRGAVSPALADRVRDLPAAVGDLSRELLAGLGDEFDLVAQYASPLAFRTLAHVLGVPRSEADSLRRHCATLVEAVDLWWTTLLGGAVEPDLAAFADAGTRAREILSGLPAEGDGLLARLTRAGRDGGRLSADEVVEQALLILMAGHEPACNLVANTVRALAEEPGRLRDLRDEPWLAADAVAESLRYDSPIQLSRRYAVRDLDVGGRTIPAGATVILAAGSANRDPARWGADADAFDLRRPDASQHLAFGRGVHHCLGAGVARTVARVAVQDLLGGFADLRLAADPVPNGRVNVRGPSSLRLSVRRA
jgi:cytochrome P450